MATDEYDKVPEAVMTVMDFHVHPKRTHDPCEDVAHKAPDYRWGYQVSAEPSTVAASDVFRQDVISRLPYAVSRRAGDLHYTGFMMDDQRIVGMKVRLSLCSM